MKSVRSEALARLYASEFSETIGITPDPWQAAALDDPHKRIILNCSRQSGKSTVAAIKALHKALYSPGSKILIVSPTQRQSGELFKSIKGMYYAAPRQGEPTKKTETELAFDNNSRILSLPGSEDTIRGYSAVSLLIIDEAARVKDDIYAAVRPMLATTGGKLILLSTPAGREGFFAQAWESQEFTHYEIDATQCPRIGEEFLAQEREALGSILFSQEYMCQFIDQAEGSMFQRHWFDIVETPSPGGRYVRSWDMAATEKGDYTASVLMSKSNDEYYIWDCINVRNTPAQNERLVKHCATADPPNTIIRMEQEPGSSGLALIDHYQRNILPGKNFAGDRATGSKMARASPFSAACEAGHVHLKRADWNHTLISQLCSFPLGEHDDMVDACSIAYNTLGERGRSAERLLKMIIR